MPFGDDRVVDVLPPHLIGRAAGGVRPAFVERAQGERFSERQFD
jgi:hypothetical protein